MVARQPQTRLVVRDIPQQFHTVEETISALNPRVLLKEVYGNRKLVTPTGYDGLLVTPLEKPYGQIGIPVACSAWYRATKWELHSKFPVDTTTFSFTQFSRAAETQQAVEQMERVHTKEDNRLRVHGVRVSYDPNPVLQEGEFFLDIASTIWAFVTHPDWKVARGELFIRCLGERYRPKPEPCVLLIGYKEGRRKITFRDHVASDLPVLIGKIL